MKQIDKISRAGHFGFYCFGFHILASILAHSYGFLHFGFYCFGFHILASILHFFVGFHILASILHIFVGAPKSPLNIQCRFCSPHSQPMHWIKHSMDWKNRNIFFSWNELTRSQKLPEQNSFQFISAKWPKWQNASKDIKMQDTAKK